jgi:hypothetical protein
VISVFGVRAEAYSRGLTGVEAAVVTDVESVAPAYLEAVGKRETGRPFYGMLLYEEPQSRVILNSVAGLAAQVADIDARRGVVAQFCNGTLPINGGPPSASLWTSVDPTMQQTVGEFFALCDAMLVRSYAEFGRISKLLKRPRRFEPVVVEPAIPAFERVRPVRPAAVVWAPLRPSTYVAWHALALMEFFGELTFVTGDGAELTGYPGRFVRPGPGLDEILARAGCVVCVDPDDPGAAVAFARCGLGVVAPLSSGAHEFVRDAVTFDIANFGSIHTAVQIAVAQAAAVRTIPVPPPVPVRPELPPADELPLVSVVLCTYNRRDDVTRALKCLEQQTYPRLEVIVVNDAGENVDDVIARFPFARPHNIAVNGGVLRAIGEGLREATGAYVQVLADDDWLDPDHIEGLVGAMLRSGAAIAHGNALIRYQDVVPGAEPVTTGFNAVVFNESTTPSEALISTPIAGNSLIFRRDVLDEIGSWREDCILADQEFQLRAAARYMFAYVDRMTVEWRARGTANLSTTTDSSVELRRVFEELHPRPDRPHLTRRRNEALANVGKRTPGVFVFPPTLTVRKGPP